MKRYELLQLFFIQPKYIFVTKTKTSNIKKGKGYVTQPLRKKLRIFQVWNFGLTWIYVDISGKIEKS